MKRKYQILWVELICNIPEVVEKNILQVKVNSDDYKDWNDKEKAANDFRNRIKAYEKEYTYLSEVEDGADTKFIQLIDYSTEIKMRNIKGELHSKILAYLVNLHTVARPIYFITAGESINDTKGILGGDSDLSEKGKIFADWVNEFFKGRLKELNSYPEKCQLICSTKKQTIQTAKALTCFDSYTDINLLAEIDYGFQDCLTREQFFEKFPEEKGEMEKDPLYYRFPKGESYADVINRIEMVLHQIERHNGPMLLILKENVLKCLYGYFAFEGDVKNTENIPNIKLPKHTIIEFIPEAYGFQKELFTPTEDTNENKPLIKKSSEIFSMDYSVFFNPNTKTAYCTDSNDIVPKRKEMSPARQEKEELDLLKQKSEMTYNN